MIIIIRLNSIFRITIKIINKIIKLITLNSLKIYCKLLIQPQLVIFWKKKTFQICIQFIQILNNFNHKSHYKIIKTKQIQIILKAIQIFYNNHRVILKIYNFIFHYYNVTSNLQFYLIKIDI